MLRASNLLSQTVHKSTVLSLPLDIIQNWLLQRTHKDTEMIFISRCIATCNHCFFVFFWLFWFIIYHSLINTTWYLQTFLNIWFMSHNTNRPMLETEDMSYLLTLLILLPLKCSFCIIQGERQSITFIMKSTLYDAKWQICIRPHNFVVVNESDFVL